MTIEPEKKIDDLPLKDGGEEVTGGSLYEMLSNLEKAAKDTKASIIKNFRV